MKTLLRQYGYAVWLAFIAGLALLHGLHLGADFPSHSPWPDWAKYTDEGWYANAAIRTHMQGHWLHPGGFNPAVAVPLWPALLALLFRFTGVSLIAARALAIALFCLNLLLVERLLRTRLSRWATLLALTLLVTSPFLFAFGRLALLEPLLLTLTLLALWLALRLPDLRHPLLPRAIPAALLLGLLIAAMVLAKTTAVFLLPAIAGAAFLSQRAQSLCTQPLCTQPRRWLCILSVSGATAGGLLLVWAALLVHFHLLQDLTYFFFINRYPRPQTAPGWLASLGWSLHGTLWIDPILLPLLGLLLLVWLASLRRPSAHALARDPVFVASLVAVAGMILFMAAQDHTQPRYYTVVAVFAWMALAQLLAALMRQGKLLRIVGSVALLVVFAATARNTAQTLQFLLHPQYTWVDAARALTAYVDAHPGSPRLLLATSGDEITLMTGLLAVNDDFGTDLPERRIRAAHPGWFASWNDLDPAILAALHRSYRLRQVATYPVMDDPERNRFVLFRLIPQTPAPGTAQNYDALSQILPADRISIPVE